MQIFIKVISDKTFPLEVDPSITVHELKTLIEAYEGMDHKQQRMQRNGKILLDFFTLEECDLHPNCTIVLTRKVQKAKVDDLTSKQPSKPFEVPAATVHTNTSYVNGLPINQFNKVEPFRFSTFSAKPSLFSSKAETNIPSMGGENLAVPMSSSQIFNVPVPQVQPSLFSSRSDTKVVKFPFTDSATIGFPSVSSASKLENPFQPTTKKVNFTEGIQAWNQQQPQAENGLTLSKCPISSYSFIAAGNTLSDDSILKGSLQSVNHLQQASPQSSFNLRNASSSVKDFFGDFSKSADYTNFTFPSLTEPLTPLKSAEISNENIEQRQPTFSTPADNGYNLSRSSCESYSGSDWY